MNAPDLFRSPVAALRRGYATPEFEAELAKIKQGEAAPAAVVPKPEEPWPFAKETLVRNKRSGRGGIVRRCERRTTQAETVWIVSVDVIGDPSALCEDWFAKDCNASDEAGFVAACARLDAQKLREAAARRRAYDVAIQGKPGRDTYHGTSHSWQADNYLLADAYLQEHPEGVDVNPVAVALAIIAQIERRILFAGFEIVRDGENGGWSVAGRPDFGGFENPLEAALFIQRERAQCST